MNEIRVTVGGGICTITTVQTSSGLVGNFKTIPVCICCVKLCCIKLQLYCIPPATPPEGVSMATVKVCIQTIVQGKESCYRWPLKKKCKMCLNNNHKKTFSTENNYFMDQSQDDCNFAHSLIFQIFIGQHLEFTLNDTLNYGSTDTSISLDLTLALVLSIGSLLLLVIAISAVMLSVVLMYKKSRRKRICDHDQPR